MDVILSAIGGLVVGAGSLVFYWLAIGKGAKARAAEILNDAQRSADGRLKDAELAIKEQTLRLETNAERELGKSREKLHQRERQLDKREAGIDQKFEDLKKQEQFIESTQNRIKVKLEQVNQTERELFDTLKKQRDELHKVTGLSVDEATTRLLSLLEDELESEVGTRILDHEKKVQEICEEKSRELIMMTTQRYAASHTSDHTTSTVDIPNDEMKGRIIGREGRNIRAFEKETGIDVIIDDTPGVVIVSGFDPVRREVARLSLNQLISDGRIHPSRIEEVVAETRTEIDGIIRKKGIEAAQEVGVNGLKKPVIDLLGRLHFRTSYSQNVLRHSVEVAFIAGMLAEMMGLDGDLARRAGLLHDIGKAADHDMDGGHPKIGADLLKRHGECEEVVHAALGHHDEILVEYPYTVVVATGDACSASRPGARRESLDRYVKRMEELEQIAKEFKGVRQAYAVQAGREVRVIASANDTDDAKAAKICRQIANAYQDRLSYPGEVKVVVVRESRFTELAK
ncbi:UNVERIFIED_CONTAM: hypothetical protein GTU68_029513 [Idotea baltica]|nr:hypothetical protein [Idotea baltica]